MRTLILIALVLQGCATAPSSPEASPEQMRAAYPGYVPVTRTHTCGALCVMAAGMQGAGQGLQETSRQPEPVKLRCQATGLPGEMKCEDRGY